MQTMPAHLQPASRDAMSANVYCFRGSVCITGRCLNEVDPDACIPFFQSYDQVYSVCLESTHVNMLITKLTAVLATGQVHRLDFASVDRSPHCTQLHYVQHEIERVLPHHIPMAHFVLHEGILVPVSMQAIECSKSLAMLSSIMAERKIPQ